MDQEATLLSRPIRWAFAAGAVALLAAMAIDFASVVGRHLGFPFVGSIELVQVCVVVAASAALVGGTLSGAHAAVHVLTERMPRPTSSSGPGSGALLGPCSSPPGGGGAWLASDTWPGDERSDLLKLPFFPFRWSGARPRRSPPRCSRCRSSTKLRPRARFVSPEIIGLLGVGSLLPCWPSASRSRSRWASSASPAWPS